MERSVTDWGIVYQDDSVILGFGNKRSNLDTFKTEFPEFEFKGVHQTHSTRVVPIESAGEEADALWTQSKKKALYIKTADCIPAFFISNGLIIAIHAGWRGLVDGIFFEAHKVLQQQRPKTDFVAVLGPHIMHPTFEIGEEVATRFADSAEKLRIDPQKVLKPHSDATKRWGDPTALAKAQLQTLGVTSVEVENINTFTHEDWNSYRREGPAAGRQLSFIALKA